MTMMKFCQTGWTDELARVLPLQRQALHAIRFGMHDNVFLAPLSSDMEDFCLHQMGLSRDELAHVLGGI